MINLVTLIQAIVRPKEDFTCMVVINHIASSFLRYLNPDALFVIVLLKPWLTLLLIWAIDSTAGDSTWKPVGNRVVESDCEYVWHWEINSVLLKSWLTLLSPGYIFPPALMSIEWLYH
jgi:hypothetical protein